MDWTPVVGTVASVLAIGGAILAGLRWVHRSVVKATSEGVAAQLAPVLAELTHNGGSTLKDKVVAIDERTKAHSMLQEARLTRLENRVDDLFTERRED